MSQPFPIAKDDSGLAFEDAALGRGLVPEAENLIVQAGALPQQPEEAERLLLQAQALAPSHPAPLIALYRHHFYGHRLGKAREIAVQALAIAKAALGEQFAVQAPSEEQARFDAAVRFYLFSLKGYAYLNFRLGDMEVGRRALEELRRLDPQDQVGGSVLASVLARLGREDEDDSHGATPSGLVSPSVSPRGWPQEIA